MDDVFRLMEIGWAMRLVMIVRVARTVRTRRRRLSERANLQSLSARLFVVRPYYWNLKSIIGWHTVQDRELSRSLFHPSRESYRYCGVWWLWRLLDQRVVIAYRLFQGDLKLAA